MNVRRQFPELCAKLAAHPSPLLQRQYLLRIEKVPATTPALARLQEQGLKTEPLRAILTNRNPEGWWYADHAGGVYKKYEGTVWSLLFAAELGAPPDDERLANSCRRFMDRCFVPATGAFESGGRASMNLACFVAHACCFLTYFGCGRDPRVASAFGWLARNVGPDGGMRCPVMDMCLNDTCTMALPKLLKAASLLTPARRKALLGDSLDRAIHRLLDVDIDRYQPVETGEWNQRIAGLRLAEVRQAKAGQKLSGEYRRKPSWMRFQFPLHYDSDLLEALIFLGRLKVPANPTLKAAAERILAASGQDGWRAGRSLRGKLWADLPHEHDWITLRALESLVYYG
jgi:hypothetical protein